MKYVIFEKESLKWELVYACDKNNKNMLEKVSHAMNFNSPKEFIKFNSNEHTCLNGPKMKNDSDMFILYEDGNRYIWQLGSQAKDRFGFIIPHTYYVRKVGLLLNV